MAFTDVNVVATKINWQLKQKVDFEVHIVEPRYDHKGELKRKVQLLLVPYAKRLALRSNKGQPIHNVKVKSVGHHYVGSKNFESAVQQRPDDAKDYRLENCVDQKEEFATLSNVT